MLFGILIVIFLFDELLILLLVEEVYDEFNHCLLRKYLIVELALLLSC